MSSNAYAPDESYSTVMQEETYLLGALFSNFFFGIQTTLCIMAFLAVSKKPTTRFSGMRIGLLVYIAVLTVVTTTAQGSLLYWTQMGFITQRNYPGGPSAFFNGEWANASNLASIILAIVANWMMECLMVWRCYVVCNSAGRLWSIGVAISSLWLIAVFVTGSLCIHFTLHSEPPVPYALAYGLASLLLNLTATGAIAGRLLSFRCYLIRQLGRGHGQHYLSIVAVVVESAAIYTSFLIVVIVTYALDNPTTNAFQQIIVQVQTITSLLIILRIARGEGWTRSTQSELVSSLNTRVELAEQNVIHLRATSGTRLTPTLDDLKKQRSFTKDTVA